MKRFFLLLIFALIFFLGVSLGYTAFVPLRKMKKIEGRVADAKPTYEQSTRSRSWHLVFTLADPIKIIRIDYSTRTEAAQDTTLQVIKLGKTYTFYINSSDVNSINAIDDNGIPIYRKPKGYTVVMGLLISFFGLIGFIVIYPKRNYMAANNFAKVRLR